MKKYEVIVLDLDDTLVDDRESRSYAFSQVLKMRGEEITNEKIEKFIQLDKEYWSKKASGEIKTPNIANLEERARWARSQRFILFFKDTTLEEAMKWNEVYIKAIEEHIVEIKGAKEIVSYLKSKKYKIYIATNGPKKAVTAKLTKIGVLNCITDCLCAEEVGYMKPRVEFFEGLMEKIQYTDREKMLIIGDELDKDVKMRNAK